MKNQKRIHVFLVDDDVLFLKSLEIYFKNNTDFEIETYASGELCMDHIAHQPDVIVLDYQLDGIDKNAMNGIETLDKIKSFYPDIPVVMLSSQDKIEVVVSCMLHNANDYVVKCEPAVMRLESKIYNFFRFRKIKNELSLYMDWV